MKVYVGFVDKGNFYVAEKGIVWRGGVVNIVILKISCMKER